MITVRLWSSSWFHSLLLKANMKTGMIWLKFFPHLVQDLRWRPCLCLGFFLPWCFDKVISLREKPEKISNSLLLEKDDCNNFLNLEALTDQHSYCSYSSHVSKYCIVNTALDSFANHTEFSKKGMCVLWTRKTYISTWQNSEWTHHASWLKKDIDIW